MTLRLIPSLTATLLLLAPVALAAVITEEPPNFDGHVVVRVVPNTQNSLRELVKLQDNATDLKIDFWKEPSKIGKFVDIMVPITSLMALGSRLRAANLAPHIVVDDVQKLVDADYAHIRSVRPFRKGAQLSDFRIDEYHSFDDIMNWLEALATANPSLAEVFSIGPSFEGRQIKGIKIGKAGANKPGFWLDAGIHAREWIAPATAVYIINELITKYGTDPKIKNFVDKIDFYIAPSINPDGYEYTRSTNRMWRKTRGGPYCSGIRCCYGADPNRNWPFQWMVSGSSPNPCSDTYGGPKAWSEPECQQVGGWLMSNKDHLKAYISLHSYSQLWMYSYGYKDHTYPPDVAELKALAEESVAALAAVHGKTYEIGSPTDILYAASGASDDWAKAIPEIKWTYTIELRPDQFGQYGFQLPADQIVPTGEETWAGLQVLANKLLA